MRARHRLSKFLLRRELVFPGPGKAWTHAHLLWLQRLTFDDVASRVVTTDYLAAVQALVHRRGVLEAALEQLIPTSPYADVVGVLRCFRGVDTLTAAGLAAEIGDSSRFDHPDRLAGFLGIVPCEHTSDGKRRQGSITKAGPGHARRLLVEAAHHYRRPPRVGVTLSRRQQDQDPRVCAIAWRAQQRLHRQWTKLHGQRRKRATVTAVAVARELSGFLWEAATVKT